VKKSILHCIRQIGRALSAVPDFETSVPPDHIKREFEALKPLIEFTLNELADEVFREPIQSEEFVSPAGSLVYYMAVEGSYGSPESYCPLLWSSYGGRHILLYAIGHDLFNEDELCAVTKTNWSKLPRYIYTFVTEHLYSSINWDSETLRYMAIMADLDDKDNIPEYVSAFAARFYDWDIPQTEIARARKYFKSES